MKDWWSKKVDEKQGYADKNDSKSFFASLELI